MLVADTVAKGHFRRWIGGKRYIPQQKSERRICGMSTRGWKECRRRRTFPVTRRLSTNRVPLKRGFFFKFDPLMETFLEYETICRSHHLDTCSWEVWRKSIQGKWQKWCVVHVTKKQRGCDFAGNVQGLVFSGLNPTCQVSSKSIQVSEIY